MNSTGWLSSKGEYRGKGVFAMSERIPITREGLEKLKAELQRLKKVERPKIIKEIETARSYGDLSENAEYEAAKEKQGLIEARIRELEYKISHAYVVDTRDRKDSDRVAFGATVRLLDLDTEREVTYTIVGPDESDLSRGRISIQSPIAKGLMGKRKGDTVIVKVPRGEIEYEILDVRYEE